MTNNINLKKLFSNLFLSIVLAAVSLITVKAQPEKIKDAAELKLALEKLNVLGSVLYIAAHPDDENTALLSYFSSGSLFRTGYLALTRGDGGQNLIGSEQAELLGVIRTQELLAARRIDGAEQFFTRAIDFGFSKSPEESFNIWGKDKILSDVVWVIRKFKPDVIITRFPTNGAGGHGHHTASAILAIEAFKIAGDKNAFPEQLKYVQPWQPKRIYWNAWSPEAAGISKDSLITIDLGSYNSLLGKSYSEIAAISRSMHKSQGFGSSARRGEIINYFSYFDGEPAKKNLFDNIDVSWKRVPGSEKAAQLISEANNKFDMDKPSSIIPILINAYKELKKLHEDYWVTEKEKELLDVIRSAAGLWMEAAASDYSVVPGGELKITSGIVDQSKFPFILKDIKVDYKENSISINKKLDENFQTFDEVIQLPQDVPYTQPYWLKEEPSKGIYNVDNQLMIGKPENDPPISAEFTLVYNDVELPFKIPVLFRWTDPVKGEQYRSIEITPPVTMNFENSVNLFPEAEGKKINLSLKAFQDNLNGNLSFKVPSGWRVEPENIKFSFQKKNEEKDLSVSVYPPPGESEAKLIAAAEINDKSYSKGIVNLSYPHIPIQTLFIPAETKIIKLNINKVISSIGYIMGSGDNIPFYLQELGYKVTLLNSNDIENGDLSKYDAIIAGIRAYNTRERLPVEQPKLLDYINNGGTFLVQYTVDRGTVIDQIGPYPFNLSRDRVTVEEAPVRFLKPDHQLLNFPNKISEKDFDGWIQERGLYFADKWDPKYETLIECHDPGEAPKEGGMLFTHYGKGIYIYSGYSWFRQLPAGVPGAYRIFVNLISPRKKFETGQSSK